MPCYRLVCLYASVVLVPACAKKRLTPEQALNFAQQVQQDVVSGLQKTLLEKVETLGAAGALSFCREHVKGYGQQKMAEWLARAQELPGIQDFRFRRISLRNRNPANAPDNEQRQILEQWQNGKASPVLYENDGKFFVMQPIYIQQPLCLKCHGDEKTIDPKAVAAIRQHYPGDKATGYRLGDLRGAFIVEFKTR
ncbi:MAG: DUF3365 domain-containing protein [Turneriella sp.]|nr:DUF3365 domain-containing protein [Turneriella sp.]